jgi:4-hydroxybenzoate polyprenyltransferase
MPYILLLRPHNWIKNFFVFIPLFFAHRLFNPEQLSLATYAFLAFCLAASSVYVINDIVDRKNDAHHPKKKLRPIASGAVSLRSAWAIAVVLLLLTVAIMYFYVPAIAPVIAVYLVANLAYSFYLKRVAILDILMVAGFYVLRVSAGALAVDVRVSGWLLLATIFVALFLVVAKRKAELLQSEVQKQVPGETRAVLQKYSPELLGVLLQMSVVMMLVVYSIYTVTILASHQAAYSIFFVLLGVFRYLYLSYKTTEAEQPERLIFSDLWIFVAAGGWIIFMYSLLY